MWNNGTRERVSLAPSIGTRGSSYEKVYQGGEVAFVKSTAPQSINKLAIGAFMAGILLHTPLKPRRRCIICYLEEIYLRSGHSDHIDV